MDSAKIIGENDDVVRIMSIHKSKGLISCCYFSQFRKTIYLQDLNSKNNLLHPELGIGVKIYRLWYAITYDILSKRAIKTNENRNIVRRDESFICCTNKS